MCQVKVLTASKYGKRKVEFGIEGDGFDALVARFGRGVKKIHPIWLVREDDDFKYPRYVGLDITPT